MLSQIEILLVCIPAFPLLAAVVTALLGPRLLKAHSHWPTVVAILASFLCSAVLVVHVRSAQSGPSNWPAVEYVSLWTWASVDAADELAPSGDSESGPADRPAGLSCFKIDVVLRADGLTAMMLAMVTLISSLVAIYSVGYMHGDPGYWRFFSYIALFVFSMTMLVSVSNFVLLYVFWEAVGVCSYLLIGFWYQKPEAAAAGKKAFLVNRVGDFGFAVALFLIWSVYGTLNFHDTDADGRPVAAVTAEAVTATEAADAAPERPGVLGEYRIRGNRYVGVGAGLASGGTALAICLCLMLGACGKSAQFPLHVWLPDAMEGPSPVSALIHAATMVTAGVYMVARCTPLFTATPQAHLVVAAIGCFTALMAALIALTQFDLKRILAYSTISQLGYMFLGLGAGSLAGVTAGMFHLFTHAFFKALLFLGAGSVMHAMGNVIDVRRFGGLRKRMPITHWTFLVGCLALAGVAPLSGFWSKDGILASVHDTAHALHSPEHSEGQLPHFAGQLTGEQWEQYASIYSWLYWVAMFTAALTAFYTFRAFFMTFYGEERVPREAGHHAHESPRVMWVPLVVLAVGAAAVGVCLHGPHRFGFGQFIALTPSLAAGPITGTAQPGEFHGIVAFQSTLFVACGVLAAVYFYLGGRQEIRRLRSVMDGREFAGLRGLGWTSRLSSHPGAVAVGRAAAAVGLGGLASLLGRVLLLILIVLSTPLLLAYYLSPYKLSYRKFFFDEIYTVLVVWPLRAAAYVSYAVDRWIVDGLVNLCGWIPLAVGALLRFTQIGLVQFYALAMVVGALVLIAAKLLWATG